MHVRACVQQSGPATGALPIGAEATSCPGIAPECAPGLANICKATGGQKAAGVGERPQAWSSVEVLPGRCRAQCAGATLSCHPSLAYPSYSLTPHGSAVVAEESAIQQSPHVPLSAPTIIQPHTQHTLSPSYPASAHPTLPTQTGRPPLGRAAKGLHLWGAARQPTR